MKTNLIKHAALLLLLLSTFNPQLSASAQGTAFTYQGRLNASGSPANGLYDFRFRLDADPAGNTILATVLTNGVSVSNGLFTTTIDFGAGFFNGSNYWLEVDVTTNIPSGYTQLNPFQPFTPAPYAVFAATAENVSGAIALAQLPGVLVTNNESGVSVSGTFSGDGGGLTNLNVSASQLSSIGNINGAAVSNFFVGPSGNSTTTGSDNTALGSQALSSDTSGSENAADGYQALHGNTSGSHNTANGFSALQNNTIGVQNTAGGALALSSNTTGNNNTGYGVVALSSNTIGNNNTAVGSFALLFNTNGGGNTAVGAEALFSLLGGTNNIALGDLAGSAFIGIESSNIDIGNPGTVGDNNIIRIGTPGTQTQTFIAGVINGNGGGLTNLNASQLAESGNFNVFIGGAGSSTGGIDNVAIGDSAFLHNTGGALDTAVGAFALNSNTSGQQNSAYGAAALEFNTSGNNNTASGVGALQANQAGSNNTAYGFEALKDGTSGSANTAVGAGALVWGTISQPGGPGGTNNIALGYLAGSNYTGIESSNIVIGNVGVKGENNTIRIGTPGTQANTYIAGSVNVGLSSGANLRLNDQPVYFRSGGDTNHGLAYCGAGVTNFPLPILPDGPVMWGFTGGVLGVLNGGPHAMVSWTATGVGISNAAPGHLLVVGSSGSPAFCDGTTWQNGSDRNAKENFAAINPRTVLEKVSALPITEWKYKAEADGAEHLGPMAQDFHAAFGLNGTDDRHIATVDEEGVALAAIQGLNQKVDEKDARIQEQAREIDGLKHSVAELKQMVQALAQKK